MWDLFSSIETSFETSPKNTSTENKKEILEKCINCKIKNQLENEIGLN